MKKQIRNSRLVFPLLLLFSTLPAVSASGGEITLSDDLMVDFVMHYADVMPDDSDSLTLRDVTSPELSGSFTKMNREGFLSGQHRTVWIRFRLDNTAKAQRQWFLEYDYFKSNLELECYIPTGNGGNLVKKAYPGMSNSAKDIAYRNYVFMLDLEPGSEETIYVKARLDSAIYMVLKIWHPSVFFLMSRIEQLFIGLFVGIMFIMAFYNFFLFLSFRDSSYLLFISFIICLSILQLNNHHLLSEWLPAVAGYEITLTTVFKQLSFVSFLLFASAFLTIGKHFPRFNKTFAVIVCLVVGTGLLSFTSGFFRTLNSILLGCSGILIVIIAVMILKKRDRAAAFFLVAMAALIGFGVLVLVPAEKYYIKALSFLVPFFIDIGGLLMVSLLSFGLAYRIGVLRKEKERNDRAQELEGLKSRFFSNISHEFRTPLTLISGPLEDLLSRCEDTEQKRTYEMMRRNTGRMLRLVNQLLDLSKLESGKMKMRVCERDLIPLLSGIIECFRPITTQGRQTLSFQADENEIRVFMDRDKIEQIVLNILANAVKFTPAGGSIAIRARAGRSTGSQKRFPEGCAEISITNSGPGIPPEDLERVFDQFYQADNAAAQSHLGSGIGLALVKELVSLHRGTVEVKSDHEDSNAGLTTFTVRLPLGKRHFSPDEIAGLERPLDAGKVLLQAADFYGPEQDLIAEKKPEAAREESENDLILIIEDNAELRSYLRQSLMERYRIIEASGGDEGIRLAMETIPDLILCDVMMPETDGYAVTQRLKDEVNTSHIPIVILSAKASGENVVRGLEMGADDYITKPFNLQIVKARIANLIGLRRQLQEKIQKQLILQPSELSFTSTDDNFIRNLHEKIEKNISDPDFSIETLAHDLFMSKATLNRKIRALTGMSTNQYIQSYRLKRAAQLLLGNFGSVTDVCYAVGFSSSAYFSKCFKQAFHQLPSQYQAMNAP